MADVALWADDFNAGTSLATDYTVIDCANNAGVGVAGSRGAQTTGTASNQYFGEILKDDYVTTGVGLKFYAQGYFDHSGIGFAGGGFYAIDIRRGLNVFISIYHDVNTNGLRLLWQNAEGFDIIDTANNVYTPSTFAKIRVEWLMSTLSGLTINYDGYIKLYVDDVLIIDETGIPVMTDDSAFPNWDAIAFGPMGVLDLLEVGYVTGAVAFDGPLILGVNTDVKAKRAFAMGLDNDTHVHSTEGLGIIYGDLEVTGAITVGGSAPGADINDQFDDLGE